MKLFKQYWWIFLYLATLFISAVLLSTIRFQQYDVFYFDHGIFDQSLWKVAHFQTPLIDHLESKPISQLGDHFNPFFYLLSPVYWFTDSYLPIFVIQNLLFVASAFVLFLLAKKHIRNKFMVTAIVFAYTGFIGMQNTLISGLHPEFMALLTLSLALYFLTAKKMRAYWFFLILTLGLKQIFVGIGLGLGLYLLFKKEFRHGLATMFFSLIYYFLVIKVVIPFIAGRDYFYSTHQYKSIIEAVIQFFYPWQKTKTILISLASFAFLPLFAPFFLPAIGQDYFIRFVLANTPARTDLGLHYNAMTSVLLAFGSILGAQWLLKKRWYQKIATYHALVIIVVLAYFHFIAYKGPLGLVYNPDFYRHTKNLQFIDDFVSQIPNQGLVMVPNNLAPHLTHTHNLILLRKEYWRWMPQVIAVDFRQGQNINNYWPIAFWELNDFKQSLLNDPNYSPQFISDDQVIFIKKAQPNMSFYRKKSSQNKDL